MVDLNLTNLVVLSGSLQLRFSGLDGLDVNIHFGGPMKEKISDLGGLEGLEGLEMAGFSGLEAWEAGGRRW